MTARTLALTLVAALLVAAPLHGAVLCAKKKGSLAVRETCRPKERQIDPAALGLVGPQGPQGPAGAQGPAGNALSGTPHRQRLSSPPNFLTNSTFTDGKMLTDVLFFRSGDTQTAICSLADDAGTIAQIYVPGLSHGGLSFSTPIVVSGTLAAGCNGMDTVDILLVGTTP